LTKSFNKTLELKLYSLIFFVILAVKDFLSELIVPVFNLRSLELGLEK